ncbi:hypothetical protein Tco_0891594 [Tanacetum coccineum]|uniref:BTB domain-containing protein n=1 Tax=Tanacetum coccineum TaxID=301880 RepID=A0ABQ5C6H1_9ASTR
MLQKEDTFQVVINLVKNSTCFKAFTISANVLKIFMQQFWYSIKKVQGSDSYEFLLAKKKCTINAKVFRTILDICPKLKGVDFTDVLDDDIALTFIIDLGYKGPLYKHTNMLKFVKIGEDYQEYGLPILETMLTEAIKQSESYQMFIKYSTSQIHPKKSRGEGSQGKKTTDGSQETVDVSEESEPEPEPLYSWSSVDHGLFTHRILKVTAATVGLYMKMFVLPAGLIHDLILADDEKLLYLVRGVQQQVYGNRWLVCDDSIHAAACTCIKFACFDYDLKQVNDLGVQVKTQQKVTLSADDNIISDDPDAALELAKSISQTEAEEVEAAWKVHSTHARIMTESVFESVKKKSGGKSSKSVVIQDTLSAIKSKPATSKTKLKGAPSLTLEEQEAANIMQALMERVLDESTVVSATSNEGTGIKPGVLDEEKDIIEEKVILEWGDEQDSEHSDDDNDDVEKDDKDGDADDEGDDHINDTKDADDEDVETESDEDDIYKYKIRVCKDKDEEMINVEVDDSDKGDKEVTDAAKADAEKTSEAKDDPKKVELPPSSSVLLTTLQIQINSLLEVKIQSEVQHTQSLSVLSIPVSVITKPTVPTPVQESPSTAIATTLPPPFVSTTPSVPQPTTTLIPTPTITTDAPTVTAAVPESNALNAVELRVSKLEKDVFELKTVDRSTEALAILKSQVPFIVDNYLGSKVGDVFQKELKKHTADLILKYSLQQFPESSNKQTPTINLEQGSEKSDSEILQIKREQAEKQQKPKFTIKSTDKGVTNTVKDHKRKHDDDEDDDDETLQLDQTKETLKGKAPSKGSKTGKSAPAKEPVEEPIAEVVMDDVGDDVARDDIQP